MNKKYYIGIDTSNYTTSVSLCKGFDEILLNSKKMLEVEKGERGLRQSDAVFQHVKNLPESIVELEKILDETGCRKDIAAVGCSSVPRDTEGSYMPCFLPGIAAATSISAALGVPLYRFSHQTGHVVSAVFSSYGSDFELLKSRFAAFHVSGGTTEVLMCTPGRHANSVTSTVVNIEKLGGTKDISCGKAVDRIGVRMGFDFPSGRYMDSAACGYRGEIPVPHISVDGFSFNMSGLENKAVQLYEESMDTGKVACYVLSFISETLEKITVNLLNEYGEIPVIYSGGVMSSVFLRNRLSKYGRFASPELSSDNAAGIALSAAIKDGGYYAAEQ